MTMDDSDIHILSGLARIAPDITDVFADWADVLRRADAASGGERPALTPTLRQRRPVSDSLGWGTRPMRQTAPAARRPVDAENEFHGWGTRRF